MPKIENLTLRVNGQVYTSVILRLSMEDGFPGGPWEVVLVDPLLGPVTLNSNFHIELKEEGGDWKTVQIPYLISMISTH